MDEFPRWLRSDYTFTTPQERGERGKRVKLIQEWLILNDLQIVADGDFGAATEAAILRFQKTRRLPATGSVNLATFNALIEPMRRALIPIPLKNRTFNQLVIAYAEQHEKEHPR